MGLSEDENSKDNVIDVFTVDELSGGCPVLTKIYTRKFKAFPDMRFRLGAGTSFDCEDRLSLYSCGEYQQHCSDLHLSVSDSLRKNVDALFRRVV